MNSNRNDGGRGLLILVTRLIGRYPAIAVRMLDRMAHRLREAEDRLADVAYRPVHARVANALLRLGQSDREVHLSHQDLAEIVGTHRETVRRTLNQFRTDGLVELERMLISVMDDAGLQKVGAETRETSCENARVSRRKYSTAQMKPEELLTGRGN